MVNKTNDSLVSSSINENLIWYVSYGSNTFTKRFMMYINGEKTEGIEFSEIGCFDKTKPRKVSKIIIDRELKFLWNSNRWNNLGVAAISLEESDKYKTYCVMYLITAAQFMDIVKQENNLSIDTVLPINEQDLEKGITKKIFEHKRYSTILNLGIYEGYQAYTFTCDTHSFNQEYSVPDSKYVSVILNGLYNTYEDTFDVVLKQFIEYKGIKGEFNAETLKGLIDI